MFFHKLCKTKLVDLFETNNFVFLRFFRISHIIVRKLNFGFSIVIFSKNYFQKQKSSAQSLNFDWMWLKIFLMFPFFFFNFVQISQRKVIFQI